jgi:hypothetical protein
MMINRILSARAGTMLTPVVQGRPYTRAGSEPDVLCSRLLIVFAILHLGSLKSRTFDPLAFSLFACRLHSGSETLEGRQRTAPQGADENGLAQVLG